MYYYSRPSSLLIPTHLSKAHLGFLFTLILLSYQSYFKVMCIVSREVAVKDHIPDMKHKDVTSLEKISADTCFPNSSNPPATVNIVLLWTLRRGFHIFHSIPKSLNKPHRFRACSTPCTKARLVLAIIRLTLQQSTHHITLLRYSFERNF